jgi:Pregnancy-associated plasma protein-A
MKKIFSIVIAFCFTSNLLAQRECGTPLPKESFYDSSLSRMYEAIKQKNERAPQATTKYIRVIIVNFLSDDGTDSSWSKAEMINEFQQAKDLFKSYDICLQLIGVDYFRNTATQNYQSNSGPPLSEANNPTALKIYLHKTLKQGTLILNGIAYTLIGNNLSLSRGALGKKSLAHEIGHCFGLLHTFEVWFGVECPDGSNSAIAGDKINDTRATPNDDAFMQNNTDSNCVYTGNRTINCNNAVRTYNPEVSNMMSYGRRECRSNFSPYQVSLMHSNLENSTSSIFPLSIMLNSNTTISNTTIATDNVFIDNSTLTIGDFYSTSLNTFLGFQYIQRFLGVSQVKISNGTRILPTSDRSKVTIKTTAICDEPVINLF